jgi:SAM-dependent methyltransferase
MENNEQEFWEMRWQHQQTGWDLGVISPPIKQYIDSIDDKNQRILIPGCGNAHEAVYLLEKGFTNVTVIDIAPSLTNILTTQLQSYITSQKLTVMCGDFFELKGSYDLIIEQTFFCAIHPSLRNQYAQQIKNLLAPSGRLVGLLFDKIFEGGPPFGGNIKEYEGYFKPIFKNVSISPCSTSAKPRAGNEVWIELIV